MRKSTGLLVAAACLLIAHEPAAYHVPRSLDEVVEERRERASSPASVLDVHELGRLWDSESPEAVLAAVREAAGDERAPRWVTGYARWLQGQLELRLGRLEEARETFGSLDFIQRWHVVGPFDNDNESGFERAFPPEEQLGEAMDVAATYQGRLRRVGWRPYPTPASPDGATSLGAVLDPSDSSCAYLATVVESRTGGRAALRLGFDGSLRAWLNGVEVYEDAGQRRAVPDRSAAGVTLRRGRNRLVVKSCVLSGGWNLYARITRPDGEPMPGLRYVADDEVVSARPPRGAGPSEAPSLWTWFHVAAEQAAAPAGAHADLARFLLAFGGDDPDEHRARDEAEAAVEGEPSVEHLRLLARVHRDRNERARALERALAQEPRRVDVLLALAGERMDGPRPEDALELIARAERAAPGSLHAAVARADLLDTVGMTLTALAGLRRLAGDHDALRLHSAIRGLAARAGLDEEERAAAERYFAAHRDSAGLRIELSRHAVERGDFEGAAGTLREGLAIAPLSSELRLALASVLEAAGEMAAARRVFEEALEQRPQDGELHERHAHFLDRAGEAEEAVAAARRSLELRPENPSLREWLSVVSQDERFEEPYVESPETFLARRGRVPGHDVHTLVDLRVRQVHQSGQSSEFRQVAFEATTMEGARQIGRYQVAYAPDRQRLRVERARVHRPDGTTREAVSRRSREVYDPSVRMYYDIRVVDVLFGDLQPGDVVEIRYRLSDVGGANELGDYFGELVLMQTFNPRSRSVYVLLVPEERSLVFEEGRLEGLEHRTRDLGEVVEHVLEAEDVAPISFEPGMPPLQEVAGSIHVSTYSSWEELGRWYWSLVRDQLELDAGQRRRAEELTAGAADELARVRAIHRHVVQSVRYVALEFGVHRYKPYRVSDIERRGFGDCKDQASLMIAMLRHVGVDAQIALVRTRTLGNVGDQPPSLEVFNHAIVYVPSLSLYIDPTAERVAVGDLPSVDQGVMALRVAEGVVVLERTPLYEASRQGRRIAVELSLDREGTGRGTLQMDTTGWLAGSTRSALDDPENRDSYLERLLSRYLRGVDVSNVRTTDLTELDSDTSATVDVEVPGLARVEGESLSFPVSLAPPLSGLVSHPEREHPLVLGPPLLWEEELEIAPPAGMTVEGLPAAVEVETELARFRLAVERSGSGPVSIRSSLAWRAERVEPASYEELRRLVERVTAARTARIRLVPR